LSVMITMLPVIACAQPTTNQMTQLRQGYNDCFYESVNAQLRQQHAASPGTVFDLNMVSELAFQACLTEERAMVTLLASLRTQPQVIAAAMTSVKLQLKREIRKMAADIQKFLEGK
jgi:hypothetical protein